MRGHRSNFSLATSVDLDVEGGGRLDEDYDGGWPSSSQLAWSAKGPAASVPSMGILRSARCHLAWARCGFSDANRWKEAARVAMGAPDVRNSILKGLILTSTIAALIFFFELAFFPSQLFFSAHDPDASSIGSVFWLYPLVAGSYFLASSWTVDVAQATYQLKHGRFLSVADFQAPNSPGFSTTSRVVAEKSYLVILVVNYTIISLILQQVPIVGKWLSFFFMSFIDAYYCFEQAWIARGWAVERRMRYAESRWAYFVAFGLPSTAVSFFHPSGLLNLMLFMLCFPICSVLAMLANPQPRVAPTSSVSDVTSPKLATSPSSFSNGTSAAGSGAGGAGTLSAFLPARLPIFWPTVKIYRIILSLFPASPTPSSGGAGPARSLHQQQQQPQHFSAPRFAPTQYGVGAGTGVDVGIPMGGGGGGAGGPSSMGGPGSTGTRRTNAAAQFVDGAWSGGAPGSSPRLGGGPPRLNGATPPPPSASGAYPSASHQSQPVPPPPKIAPRSAAAGSGAKKRD